MTDFTSVVAVNPDATRTSGFAAGTVAGDSRGEKENRLSGASCSVASPLSALLDNGFLPTEVRRPTF